MDSRKCAATVHGLRPVSTVMPPSTACAGMPRNAATASRVRSRRPERSTASSVATRDRGEHERQHPVGELDRPVLRVLRGRDERVGRAGGPGRAAEPGAGQPDDAAGDDDAGVGDHRRDRQPADQHVGGTGQLHRLSVGGPIPDGAGPLTIRSRRTTGPAGPPYRDPVRVARPPSSPPAPIDGLQPAGAGRRGPGLRPGCGWDQAAERAAGAAADGRRGRAAAAVAAGAAAAVRPAGRPARGRRRGRDPGLRGRLGAAVPVLGVVGRAAAAARPAVRQRRHRGGQVARQRPSRRHPAGAASSTGGAAAMTGAGLARPLCRRWRPTSTGSALAPRWSPSRRRGWRTGRRRSRT